MRTRLRTAVAMAALLVSAAPGLAQNTRAASGTVQHGQVVSVDQASGQIAVKLSGGENRTFHPRDGLLVNALHAGDKVRFTTARAHGEIQMTQVRKE